MRSFAKKRYVIQGEFKRVVIPLMLACHSSYQNSLESVFIPRIKRARLPYHRPRLGLKYI